MDLEKLIKEAGWTSHFHGSSGYQAMSKISNALRAVVELHQPIWTFPAGSNNSIPICLQCRDGEFEADYPCETIQAIEKELK